MIPELGHFAIILALCFSLVQIKTGVMQKTAAMGQCLFLVFAMACLMLSFLTNDMTLIYVREHSHSMLPLIYRIGAAWGGHEGSVLLWCLILSGWTVAFIVFSDAALSRSFFSKILKIMGCISAGFITFLLATSNPFKRDFPHTLITGNDLTPILQDPGLIFHPPMLYLGYVGFAIGFSFAIAALLEGKFDPTSARACRPWVILPWSFLSCGIVLGSWWAYRELGWGGWWFWDPVENASLLPWLSATALIHSLAVCEKRSAFIGWAILLAIITFSLSLLGTFLVRSGVLVSVHAFANDPSRGLFLLIYLAFIIGSALLLYGFRIHLFYRSHSFKLFSRETLLLINSVILLTAVATIVIGTLYPIILDALNKGKISVGEPYFNLVFVPIILPLLLLMGLAPHVNWHEHAFNKLWKKIKYTALISLVVGLLSPWVFGFPFYVSTGLGIAIGVWIILSTFQSRLELRHCAMVVAHLGIAITVLGIVVNKSYSQERQVKMLPGETVTLANYQFIFNSVEETQGPNYQSITAHFTVEKNHQAPQALSAEQRIYPHNQLLGKTGILWNPWRDLYLALGAPLSDGSWSVRLYYKPFVRWIWAGGFFLLFGGMLSLLRHYLKRRESSHESF